MSVLIKGLEMPENCIECPLRKGTVCDAFQLIQPYTFKDDERAAFCPMTEVPEPKMGDKTNANKIYNYLKERIGDTVDDMKEFDAWFERMVWHVKECDRLAKLTA